MPEYDPVERFFREIDEEIEQEKLKRKHTYVYDLIKILWDCKDGLSRPAALRYLKQDRRERGLVIPPNFDASVQSAYNQNCVGYSAFRKRGLADTEAPFHTPGGKGSGKWGVDQARARTWHEKRKQRQNIETSN